MGWFDKFMMAFIVFLILFVVVSIVGFIYCAFNPSPTFSLIKDQWSCSDSRTYTTTTMIMSGKVMVPMVQTHNECIQWSRK